MLERTEGVIVEYGSKLSTYYIAYNRYSDHLPEFYWFVLFRILCELLHEN